MGERAAPERSGNQTLDYRVLGSLEVTADGRPCPLGGAKQRTVVAMLVAAGGRAVSVDVLLQALYGEDAAPSSRATLQTYVSNLRQVLGGVIVRAGDAYRLDVTDATSDAEAFESAYRDGAAVGDAEEAARRLRGALAMWRGRPYVDAEAHGLLDAETARLDQLRLAAIEARLDADLRAGRHRDVVDELDALTIEHPFRERFRAMHMVALYRSGRQAEALRAYGHTRTALVDGLGIDPSPELQELEQRILGQDRTLLLAVGPTVHRQAVLVVDLDDAGWSGPAEREIAFARRDADLAAAAAREHGSPLIPKGSAGYVVFDDPARAVRAATSLGGGRARVAVDHGDVEVRDGEPVGPPLARAARLVAVAHPGQVLLSSAAHDALTASAEAGWAAASLGRFDILGLDPGVHIYQLLGGGLPDRFPPLLTDRLPPLVPGGPERSVPGYELRSVIGHGELGDVHLAYQPTVGREVAVRIFGAGMVGHPQFVRRFETTLQRITRVEHPHVAPILDYWREPERAVIVGRLLVGGHLGRRIPPAGMSPAAAADLFGLIASGIAAAHRHDVVHGRIRPDNVLFDDDDNPFVTDLGVDEICAGVVTFATHAYDAPERLGGMMATPAADVYSLGILLHHMVTGAPPPPDAPVVLGATALDAVVARAVDSDPQRRHASVAELVAEVRTALSMPVDPAVAVVAARHPYRGLAAFEQADADDFFGRDAAVAEMLATLEDQRLLLVVGPSGGGKSSAVKAGLLPALARAAVPGSDRWLVTEMVPGVAPFEQLGAALTRVAAFGRTDVVDELLTGGRSLDDVVRELVPPGQELLVVVDQFEELFTQTSDEEQRRRFVELLTEVAASTEAAVRVVLTLRADFFDRPLAYAGFGEAVTRRTVILGALNMDELTEAVRRPAETVGVEVEPALVERVAADASVQPGALPLLQHTMSELFAERRTNRLTLSAYLDGGGLAGAIGRRAESCYATFEARTAEVAHQVFLRLVSVSDDHDDTRRRVRRTELEQTTAQADELDAVLGTFGRHRLLTFDRDLVSRTPTVEVAHEALLTDWDRCAGWIDAARDDLLTRKRLESAARDWVDGGADASFLYGGARLEVVESWAGTSALPLGDDERRFLAASRHRVDRDRSARRRRRRGGVGALVAAALVTALLAVVAVAQRNTADRQTHVTRARELAGEARLAVDEDPERAVLLALAASDETGDPLPEAASALQQAMQSVEVLATFDGASDWAFDLSADGSTAAVVTQDRGGVALLDAASAAHLTDIVPGGLVSLQGLSFSPSGTELAMAYLAELDAGDDAPPYDGDPAVELFAVAGGASVGRFRGPPGGYSGVGHDPSGRWLGAVRSDGSSADVVVWDRSRPEVAGRTLAAGRAIEFIPGTGSALVIGPDGTHLLEIDVASGTTVHDIDTGGVDYGLIEVAATGTMVVATSNASRRIDVLALPDGKVLRRLPIPNPQIPRFSPDGTLVAVGASDHLIRIYDTTTFEERVLLGSPSDPLDVAFSPDNARLVSASPGQVRVWDLGGRIAEHLGNFRTAAGPVGWFDVIDPDTAMAIVSANGVRSVVRIDRIGGASTPLVTDLRSQWVHTPQVSPGHHVVAGLDADLRAKVVDVDTGAVQRLAPCENVFALDEAGTTAFVDGQVLCTEQPGVPSVDGARVNSRVVELDTGRTVLDLGATAYWHAVFGPPDEDGHSTLLAVQPDDAGPVGVYDLRSGELIGRFVPPEFALSMRFTPDGDLLIGTASGRLVVVDVARLGRSEDGAEALRWIRAAHNGSLQATSASVDGLIASGSTAGNVRLWSPEGEPLADLAIETDVAPTSAFSADGRALYYADDGGVIRRFLLDDGEREALARSLLTRWFTPDECARYFPDQPCPASPLAR